MEQPNDAPGEDYAPYAAVEEMRLGLSMALEEFRHGSQRSDGGREGMIHALFVATMHLQAHFSDCLDLIAPLECLRHALRDLNSGCTHPALQAMAIPNRKPMRWDVAEFKGRCLAASDILTKQGELTREAADFAIYKRVTRSSARLQLRMTEKSLQTWRRDARKAVDSNGKPVTSFGFWVLFMRDVVTMLDESGGDTNTQVAQMLEMVSESRLSHLPF